MARKSIENKSYKQVKPELLSSTKVVNDSDYNERIYEWRRTESGPIIQVFGIKKFTDVDPMNGSKLFKHVAEIEKIEFRLNI